MKRYLSAALLILSIVVSIPGQNLLPKGKRECGTVLTEAQIRAENERDRSGFYRPLSPQANRPIWIPMAIHIVRRANGTGGLNLANLKSAFDDLNRLWLPVGIQFYHYGNIDYIDNDFYYNVPDSQIARDNLRRINPVANAVNTYFTDELATLCGQASFTTDDPQGVLIDNDCADSVTSPSTWSHEVGHYFDLFHTHEINAGLECPSGSNCSTAGDRICDTPADPELNFDTNVNESCQWTGTALPPPFPLCSASQPGYNPPTRNVMSYSRRTCRTQFTANQNSKSLSVLLFATNRSNLINLISRYVAPDGDPFSGCGYTVPCRTLARAVQFANAGDHIFMLTGNYSFTPFNKAVFIKKWNTDAGDVFIVP